MQNEDRRDELPDLLDRRLKEFRASACVDPPDRPIRIWDAFAS